MATGPDRPRRIVLDTSAYSWFCSGHSETLDAIARADVVWMPTVVLGELEAGFAMGSRQRANRARLDEFLSEPFVAIRSVTREVAGRYGQVFAHLRRAGTPIPLNDVWIAATTLDSRGCLVSFDRHFEQIAGMELMLLSEPPR